MRCALALADSLGWERCRRRKRAARMGIASHATKKETTRLDAMERERDAKNAPVTPTRNAGGMWMMIVESDEPSSGLVNSSVAASTRPSALSMVSRDGSSCGSTEDAE